jgi:hypothetical protein
VRRQAQLSSASKLTVAALVVATVGVVIQMVSGFPYPTIPPVFFIQLVPAALIGFGRWAWAPVTAILGGAFLMLGLFASGASARLFDLSRTGGVGGSIGLWVQMLAVAVAIVAAIAATIQGYRSQTAHTLSPAGS